MINPNSASILPNRWKNRDELKYSLRSVYKFAPWVRNIYIVTDDQKPNWLVEDYKLKIVDHKIIIPKEFLPTFSSVTIEQFLHRIPNLSEIYLYFNDDMFLGNVTTPNTFITPNKLRKVFLSKHVVPNKLPTNSYSQFYIAEASLYMNNELLNKLYGYESTRYKGMHTPHVRSVSDDMQKFISLFPEYYATATNKFRSVDDIHDNWFFDNYWGVYNGTAVKSKIHHIDIFFDNDYKKNSKRCKKVENSKPTTFNINDDITDPEIPTDNIINFLEEYYPQKSPWENE